MKNDLSFIVANRLNLYEHQSTFCPNMPLRGLLYFSRQYEGLIAERKDNIYGSKLIRIPTPAYVIFYNGAAEQPDRMELYLSDAFEGGRDSGCLECRALMLNINRGRNQELLNKCRRLWEYSEFISEVNDNLSKGHSLKRAVTIAMDHCIERGILADVLVKSRGEVMHMLLTEYNEKRHMKSIYEEGYEEGEQAGYSAGERAGYSAGEQAGYSAGEQAGRNLLLEELIRKKCKKGKSVEAIAEELEEDPEVIRDLIETLKL